MGDDLPDYTRKVIIEYTGGFIGLEELATRLGFIAPFNLQGNLVLMEDFETEETEWDITDVGLGGAIVRSSRHKYSGNWSLKLTIPATTGAYASPLRQLHFPGLVKYGIFGRFCFDDDCQIISMGGVFCDGINEYDWAWRYNLVTTTLEIYRQPGAWQTISATLLLANPPFTWYPFLITFDLATQMYDKLYVGGQEYDISAYEIYWGANVEPLYSTVDFAAQTPSDDAFVCYCDDLVIVKNVP